MNTIIRKIALGGLLVILSACAHYQYPAHHRYAGPYPAYGNGYVVRERGYDGDYPYRYNANSYAGYGQHYGYDHDDRDYRHERPHHHDHNEPVYRSRPRQMGELKPSRPNGHRPHPGDHHNEPLAINDRVYGFSGQNFNESRDGDYKLKKLYRVDRKTHNDPPDRSRHDHHKHEWNHRP